MHLTFTRNRREEEIYQYTINEWEKKLEKYREIEFGYNPITVKEEYTESDTIESKVRGSGDYLIQIIFMK